MVQPMDEATACLMSAIDIGNFITAASTLLSKPASRSTIPVRVAARLGHGRGNASMVKEERGLARGQVAVPIVRQTAS
jgi:hypothetical protein